MFCSKNNYYTQYQSKHLASDANSVAKPTKNIKIDSLFSYGMPIFPKVKLVKIMEVNLKKVCRLKGTKLITSHIC